MKFMLTFSFEKESFKILGRKGWYIFRLVPQDFSGKPFEQIGKPSGNAVSGIGKWNSHRLSTGFTAPAVPIEKQCIILMLKIGFLF